MVDETYGVIDCAGLIIQLSRSMEHVGSELSHQNLKFLRGILTFQGGEELGTTKVCVSQVREFHYSGFHFFGCINQLLKDVFGG